MRGGCVFAGTMEELQILLICLEMPVGKKEGANGAALLHTVSATRAMMTAGAGDVDMVCLMMRAEFRMCC
jgi:hypothetical protein